MCDEEIIEKNALVIMAHPDDAEIVAGGTIAKWVEEGWKVTLAICTDGASGGFPDSIDVSPAARSVLAKTRVREQVESAKILGVAGFAFLKHDDGTLQPTLELRQEVVRLIRVYRPYRLISPSPERTWGPQLQISHAHPDHLACGEAVISAFYPASYNAWDFPELLSEGLPPHRVTELYVTNAPYINHGIDITDTLQAKILAVLAHASQFPEVADISEFIRKQARASGQRHGKLYAEGFHRMINTEEMKRRSYYE